MSHVRPLETRKVSAFEYWTIKCAPAVDTKLSDIQKSLSITDNSLATSHSQKITGFITSIVPASLGQHMCSNFRATGCDLIAASIHEAELGRSIFLTNLCQMLFYRD